MKAIIIVIIIAVAGYFTYDHFFATKMSSSYKTYEKFANHLDEDQFSSAIAMATDNAGVDDAAQYRREWEKAYKNLSVRETLRKVDYADRGEGYASYTILQKTFTNPSTTPPGTADFLITQEVELETDDEDEWVIVQFSEVIEEYVVEK